VQGRSCPHFPGELGQLSLANIEKHVICKKIYIFRGHGLTFPFKGEKKDVPI